MPPPYRALGWEASQARVQGKFTNPAEEQRLLERFGPDSRGGRKRSSRRRIGDNVMVNRP